MINPFIMRKWGAMLLLGMCTTIGFYSGMVFGKSIVFGLVGMGIMLFITMIIANMLLNNPFRAMLEGKGVLAIDINSTGILRPFILSVLPPFVHGNLGEKLVKDVFDREMVYNITVPQKAGIIQQGKGEDGTVRTAIVLDEEEYNKGRFGMFHYPVVLFNSQMNSIITKDWFSEKEKGSIAEHTVLYLNQELQRLTTSLLNFGRYVVEQTKPKGSIWQNKWLWIIIVGFVIFMIVLFAPSIIPLLKSSASSLSGAASTTVGAVGRV